MATFLHFSAFILSMIAFFGIGCEAECRLILSPSSEVISVPLGGNGKITCSFSSDCELSDKRVISPYWEKTDHVNNERIVYFNLKPTEAMLLYNDIQDENMGEYQCRALVGEESLMSSVVVEKKSTI